MAVSDSIFSRQTQPRGLESQPELTGSWTVRVGLGVSEVQQLRWENFEVSTTAVFNLSTRQLWVPVPSHPGWQAAGQGSGRKFLAKLDSDAELRPELARHLPVDEKGLHQVYTDLHVGSAWDCIMLGNCSMRVCSSILFTPDYTMFALFIMNLRIVYTRTCLFKFLGEQACSSMCKFDANFVQTLQTFNKQTGIYGYRFAQCKFILMK